MSCPSCLVQVVLSKKSCPGCPLSTGTVVLSWLPYVSWMSCPKYLLSTAVVVPFRLSCLSFPVLTAIFWPLCLCFLSWLYYPASLSNFPVPVLLSPLFCPGCPVLTVLSWLAGPSHPIPAVLPGCPVPAIPSQLSCPCCPVPAVLF